MLDAARAIIPGPEYGRLATPAAANRVVALDHLRGSVVALVVLHHAVLAYCRYAHFNQQYYLLSTAPVVVRDDEKATVWKIAFCYSHHSCVSAGERQNLISGKMSFDADLATICHHGSDY